MQIAINRPHLRGVVAYIFFACALLLIDCCAWAEAPTIPNTSAGHALKTWLHAFNHSPPDKRFGRLPGGFDLLLIDHSEPNHIEFLLRARSNQGEAFGELDVSPRDPGHITHLTLLRVPSEAHLIGFEINRATRDRVIKALISKLQRRYVIPASGNAMARAIASQWTHGQYDSITNGQALAIRLTTELQSMSHDGHLRVAFSPAKLSRSNPLLAAALNARARARLLRDNCGFDEVERLPHNIGYLKFDEFGERHVCGPTAIAAMNFLANVDAIIFDLRENHGGRVGIGALIDSYLFARPTLLYTLHNPRTGVEREVWTPTLVRGHRRPTVPVYVLTSRETFSGAEAFAYTLQALKRATVIGEVTGGGAYLVAPAQIGRRFVIAVPAAYPINPVTKSNWEGTGVVPNVRAPAGQALALAQKLAYHAISTRNPMTHSSPSR